MKKLISLCAALALALSLAACSGGGKDSAGYDPAEIGRAHV